MTESTTKTKWSECSKLTDLEAVINTRTSVVSIGDRYGGDIRIKLDTDVNEQEWYVLQDDSGSASSAVQGILDSDPTPCWAFEHFNGSHNYYRFHPVHFCFETFADLLQSHLAPRGDIAMWGYDLDDYARRTAPRLDDSDVDYINL